MNLKKKNLQWHFSGIKSHYRLIEPLYRKSNYEKKEALITLV